MSEIVRIQGLRKSFGQAEILKGIDLSVNTGEVVVMIGGSGSGKSTCLRCINRLETPSSGTIVVVDSDVTCPRTDLNQVRQNIGMVFQGIHLYPHMTALGNVMLALRKVKDPDRKSRICVFDADGNFLEEATRHRTGANVLALHQSIAESAQQLGMDEAALVEAGATLRDVAKITVFVATVLTIVVVMGAVMYLIEGEENGFTDIPTSIYWAVVTLTTVGYGDIAPKTPGGRFLAAAVMILGALLCDQRASAQPTDFPHKYVDYTIEAKGAGPAP